MPISIDEQPSARVTGVRVEHSAVTELYFATCGVEAGRQMDFDARAFPGQAALAARLSDFWSDEKTFGSELLVIAWNAGTFFSSAAAFLDAFPAAAALDPPAGGLEHETEEDRETIRRRLLLLAREPSRAGRMLDLLRGLWAAIDSTVSGSRPAIEAEVEALTAAFLEAEDPAAVFPESHLIHRYSIEGEIRAAARAGQLVVTPSAIAGPRTSFLELPGLLTVGIGLGRRADGDRRRRAAADVASRLKVLSDPTRVEALLLLGRRAYTVSDLAREMGMAQPTISVHVKMLREAGLLRSQKADGRTSYRADADHVRSALTEVGQILETS